MNRHLHFAILILLGIGVTGAFAQRSRKSDDFNDLRDALDGLDWKNVDFDAMSAVDRCRALTLLDHALTEIGAVATAEADLMSEYVEQQGLGAKYATSDAAKIAPGRTYKEGKKTAAALLKGPMADTRYATMYEGSTESDLNASLRLHESASKRKWGQFSDPVLTVRSMNAFLMSNDKSSEYQVWAKEAYSRRQQDYEAELAERRAAAKSKANRTEEERAASVRELADELAEQQRQAQESRLAQQAIYAQADANAQAADNNYESNGWYPRRYDRVPLNPRVRSWHRNGASQVRARQHTQQRMNSWRGAGAAGGAGGKARGAGRGGHGGRRR